MRHVRFTEKIHLLAAGEVEGAERKALEDHVAGCAECRDELERFTRLGALVAGARPRVEVDEKLLQEARWQLAQALRRERARRGIWEALRERVADVVAPRYQAALGGAALLAAGIVLGRLAFVPTAEHASRQALSAEAQEIPADARITNVKFLDAGGGLTGQPDHIEFTFEAVRPVRMSGSINDPQIQRVLTHAMLNDENPGVRLRAVSAMTAPSIEQPDREIKTALILALKTDPNAAVRKEALSALRRLPPDDDIKNALLNTLMTDRNPALRIAAINGFDSLRVRGQSTDASVVNALRNRMQSDDNSYIRLKARTVLQEVRQQ